MELDEWIRYCREDPHRLFDVVVRSCDILQGQKTDLEADLEGERRRMRSLEEDILEKDTTIAEKDAVISEKEIIIEGLETEQSVLMRQIAQMVLDGGRVPVAQGARKSTKIPDPPELVDGTDPTFDDWVLLMKEKLEANADHYDTPQLRIAYVVSRTKGEARSHVIERRKDSSPDKYRDASDIFEHLHIVYNDVNKTLVAREKLRKLFLRQSDKFHTFLSEFLRLAAETKIPKEEWKEELHRRLTVELQKMTAAKLDEEDVPFKAFAEHCSRMASRLGLINGRAQRSRTFETRTAHTSSSTSWSKAPSAKASSPAIKVERDSGQIMSISAEAHEQLMRQGKCFGCQEFGHIRKNCPKARVSQLKVMEGNRNRDGQSSDIAEVTENEEA
jgi:hypothetical protein